MQRLPLLTPAGVRMGEIADAFYEPYEQRILAFVVEWEDAAAAGADNLLPLTQITELNADIATVADEIGVSAGLQANLDRMGDNWLPAFEKLLDRPVVDEAGNTIGRLADMHFDPQDGSVEFYEVVLEEQADPLMLPPAKGLDVVDGKVLVPGACIEAARKHANPPSMGIAFLEAEGMEDHVGEDDIEVARITGAEPG
jgi:sporulation protein YlmC with PRC-barrel domain